MSLVQFGSHQQGKPNSGQHRLWGTFANVQSDYLHGSCLQLQRQGEEPRELCGAAGALELCWAVPEASTTLLALPLLPPLFALNVLWLNRDASLHSEHNCDLCSKQEGCFAPLVWCPTASLHGVLQGSASRLRIFCGCFSVSVGSLVWFQPWVSCRFPTVDFLWCPESSPWACRGEV